MYLFGQRKHGQPPCAVVVSRVREAIRLQEERCLNLRKKRILFRQQAKQRVIEKNIAGAKLLFEQRALLKRTLKVCEQALASLIVSLSTARTPREDTLGGHSVDQCADLVKSCGIEATDVVAPVKRAHDVDCYLPLTDIEPELDNSDSSESKRMFEMQIERDLEELQSEVEWERDVRKLLGDLTSLLTPLCDTVLLFGNFREDPDEIALWDMEDPLTEHPV